MTMRDKTLCFYHPQQDKALNVRKTKYDPQSDIDYIEFEFRGDSNRNILLTRNQMKELKDWMRENGI